MKSDESIIGTLNGVIKAKTVRRLPEDQTWCAEEVFNIRGVPSNPLPSDGGDHIPMGPTARGAVSTNQNTSVRCNTHTTVAAQDSKEKFCNQSIHQRIRCHRGEPRVQGD